MAAHRPLAEPIATVATPVPNTSTATRMEEDLLIPGVHWLYRGDTPLHLAVGATLADVDGNGVTAADRIRSQALRDALAGT